MAAERKTQKVNVWLDPDQAEWLKGKKNISETVRALITEAINMENLAKSVKKKGTPAASRPARRQPGGAKKAKPKK